jgi:hypothetical protein
LIISLLLLIILIFSQTRAPIAYVVERDPPSVFNYGSGGITIFYYSELGKRRVGIVYSLQELRNFDPQDYILMLLGPDSIVKDVDYLIEWIDRGGVALIGDELNFSTDMLKRLGIEYGNDFHGVFLARCFLGNKTIDIIIDVAKELMAVNSKAKPLCFCMSKPIAYNVSLGRGYAIVVGDSSIVINEILSQPTFAKNNTELAELVIGNRGLLIYEGSRIYTPVYAQAIAQFIDELLNGLTQILRWIIVERGAISSLEFALGVVAVLMVYMLIKFGIQENPKRYLEQQRITKNVAKDVQRRILIGVSTWGKLKSGVEKEKQI